MDDFNTAFQAAVEKETDIRDTSFQPEVPWVVCGLRLRWLTPLDYKILDDAGNQLLCTTLPPERVSLEHIAAFYWFLQFGKDPKRNGFRALVEKRMFTRRIYAFGMISLARGAREYLSDNMQDRPAVSGEGGEVRAPLPASWITILCDCIAKEYGWDDEMIIRKPIARLFQYLKLIDRRNDPESPTFNPSDSVKNMLLNRPHGLS